MFFVKLFLVVVTICGTTQADMLSNIPILGGVLGTVSNASKTVLNTAVDAVQLTSEKIIGKLNPIENIIVNQVKKILKELRDLMFDEIPLLGLPRLEPYEQGHVDIDITHEIGTFEGTMDNVVITGLSNFTIDRVTAKINTTPILDPNITIDLYYDTLNISGYYDIVANIGELFNVWGKGKFNLTMHQLQINASVVVIIDINRQQIKIDDIAVNIKLKNMTCNFENLLGGGETGDLFNRVIGELAPEAVDVLWPEIRPGLEAKVKEVSNLKIDELGYDTIISILFPFLPKPKPTTEQSLI